MRCAAACGLLVLLVGCDQVFGIAPTRGFDAGADVVPDRPHVVLDWQIATVLPSGAPDPTIRFAPIDPPPHIRLATLATPFPADSAAAGASAAYSSSDGSITIPADYVDTTWRLEYTLADGIPHEVQWSPDDKQGHLTVPIFGRLDRGAVPAQSGYQISPVPPQSFKLPRVFTTGLWTEGIASAASTTVNYSFDNAVSLSGPVGRPDPSQGDRALLVDYTVDGNGCRFAVGSAALDSAALTPMAPSIDNPSWDTTTKEVNSPVVGVSSLTRLLAGLGDLAMTPTSAINFNTSLVVFGTVPSLGMPGLAVVPDPRLFALQLPMPAIQTLLVCPYSAALPVPSQPPMLAGFPHVVHVQLVDTRVIMGVTLVSGIETVLALSDSAMSMMPFPAAMAIQFTLTTPSGMLDLAGNDDELAAGPAAGAFKLDFTLEAGVDEAGVDLRTDYTDVVLHRFAGGGLTTERIYTVVGTEVQIDGSVLMPSSDYVFEIRTYKGHPKAAHGDFSAIDYPYGSATVFTRTFKTS